MIYIIAASSLRTIALSGQLSIAHAAFMAVGAYLSGILSLKLGWNPWLTFPLGGVAAMILGVLIGYPFTRLRAMYFSMVSLFSGMAIVALIGVLQVVTGGDAGLVGIPPLPPISIPGLPKIVFVTSKINYYYFLLVLGIFSLLVLYRVEHCRVGMQWKAVSQSHLVASSVGINLTQSRVIAIAVGCFFAGIAGACYAHYHMTLTSSSFGVLPSINLVIYMLVGGMGSFAGPIIGTAVLVIIPEMFRSLKEFAPFVLGGIMLIVAYLAPQGISGVLSQLRSRLRAQ